MTTKIAIVLCSVLLASAANEITEKSLIEMAAEVEDTHKLLQGKNKLIVQQLRTNAMTVADKTSNEIWLMYSKHSIGELTQKITDVNITECAKYHDLLTNATNIVLAMIRECTVSTLQPSINYMDSIENFIDRQIAKIDSIDAEFHECSDYKNDQENVIKFCHYVAKQQVKQISIEFEKISDKKYQHAECMKATFEPYFQLCINTEEFDDFYRQELSLIENTKKCIDRKIEEAQTTSQNPDTSTLQHFKSSHRQ